MDSTSSDAAFTNGNNDWTSTSVFDIDSLCSAGYYDLSFGRYSTDSVPKLIKDTNNSIPHRLSNTSFGTNQSYPFHNTLTKSKENDGVKMNKSANAALTPLPFPFDRALFAQRAAILAAYQRGVSSMPGSPPVLRRNLYLPLGASYGNPTSFPPKISLTDFDACCSTVANLFSQKDINQNYNNEQFAQQKKVFYPLTPRTTPPPPTPTPTTSPTKKNRLRIKSESGRLKEKNIGLETDKKLVPLLGSIPLYHRALSNKRRFSDNNCLAPSNASYYNSTVIAPHLNIPNSIQSNMNKTALELQVEATASLISGIPKISKQKFVDAKTVERVQNACGLFPFDFLQYKTPVSLAQDESTTIQNSFIENDKNEKISSLISTNSLNLSQNSTLLSLPINSKTIIKNIICDSFIYKQNYY